MSGKKSVNADQAEFWESASGGKWLEMQDKIDALLSEVLENVLARADIRPGQSVLDIGCGTGASVLALSALVGPEGMVEGLDISGQMLGRARQRAQDAGLANTRFTKADAQVHAFQPGAFDRVVSRFGVMFFEDTAAAFANIARAVRPGGRMVFAAWGPMQRNPWFSVPRAAAVAQLGDVPPGDPNAPGPMAFHDTERVLGLFRQAGISNARAEVVTVPLRPQGDVDKVARIASGIGPAARIMREKAGTEADARAIAARVAADFATYVTDQGVIVPAELNYYSARVG